MTRTLLKTLAPCVGALLLLGARLGANPNDEIRRVQESIDALHALTATPEKGIPRKLLSGANAIIVVPDMVKGGFIVGAKHGRGVLSTKLADGSFSEPAFITMSGGNIGWQIGVESIDLVFLVMNRTGVDDLLADKFTVGGNLSVAAGPVGRNADAATDAKLGSGILAYSRTAGLFAGATFEGAALRADKDANEAFYGHKLGIQDVIAMKPAPAGVPDIAKTWRATLRELTSYDAPR
jgi:lipid-binding SYLF domain-containing protein